MSVLAVQATSPSEDLLSLKHHINHDEYVQAPSHAKRQETEERHKRSRQREQQVDASRSPKTQNALLLHAAKEPYTLVEDYAIPELLYEGEILVKIISIGLNPVDWKGPAYNFGIPSLPWINGRDFAGKIVDIAPSVTKSSKDSPSSSRLKVGDTVFVPSTDYRDIRKAAFQEYAVATVHNAIKIPSGVDVGSTAALGVAFIAAALGLGVSFGLKFGDDGPDLTELLRKVGKDALPTDVQEECFTFVEEDDTVKAGDWIALWGASTTTGYIAIQLAKRCGLRVICIADVARHGSKLLEAGADLLVDRLDTDRAVDIIRGVTGGKLRFGMDIVGVSTSTILQRALFTPSAEDLKSGKKVARSHLVGYSGLPKEKEANIRYHHVPIKIFHACHAVGEGLAIWLEKLLRNDEIRLPEVVKAEGGLEGINDALELLKDGTVSGKRVVVHI